VSRPARSSLVLVNGVAARRWLLAAIIVFAAVVVAVGVWR
jgi:hypothetical protein